jgi:hypothetical protein
MSLSEIGAACLGRSKPNVKLIEALKQLTDQAAINEWPSYRRSRIFSERPLRSAVEDAFVAVLDGAPLTIAKAARPVSQALGRVSEDRVLAELRGVAPKLAEARKIVQVPVNRQSVVYISIPYLGRLLPAKSAAATLRWAEERMRSPGDVQPAEQKLCAQPAVFSRLVLINQVLSCPPKKVHRVPQLAGATEVTGSFAPMRVLFTLLRSAHSSISSGKLQTQPPAKVARRQTAAQVLVDPSPR